VGVEHSAGRGHHASQADVRNLCIVDGSALATGGVVNPTNTICALALRAAPHLRDNFADLRRSSRTLPD
jgi:2-methyl-1,2-propanediol dehydrogenase